VVSRFARDHRLPYETPAGVEVRVHRTQRKHRRTGIEFGSIQMRRVENLPYQSRGKLGEYSTALRNSGSVPRQKRRKCGSSAKVMTWPRPYGSLTR
jgi:hypothetical protein